MAQCAKLRGHMTQKHAANESGEATVTVVDPNTGDGQAVWEGVQRLLVDMALRSPWTKGHVPGEFVIVIRGEVRKATPADGSEPARPPRIVLVGELTEVSRLQHVVAKVKP
jgi:hypothetical protein